MKKELIEKFFVGDFEGIDILLKNMEINKQKELLMELAFETEYLSIYTYVSYRICNEKEIKNLVELHQMAAELLSNCYNFIEGGYSAAFFHAKKVLELKPEDIGSLEQMLFYYIIPEKILDSKKALEIAKKIIKVDKGNRAAKRVLGELG